MGVQLDGQLYVCLECLHQTLGGIGRQQSRHILDANRVRTCFLNLLCIFYIVFLGEYIPQSVGNCHLGMCAFLLCRIDGGFQVPDIVQRIKNPDHVNAVCHRLLYKILHHIVCIVPIAQHILTTEQHLQLGVGHVLFQRTQTLPGILVEKPQAGIKGRTAPALDGVITHLIQLFQNRQHLSSGHTGCDQGLVCVTEHGFRNLYFSHIFHHSSAQSGKSFLSEFRQWSPEHRQNLRYRPC